MPLVKKFAAGATASRLWFTAFPSTFVPDNRFVPVSSVKVRVNLERTVPLPVKLGPSPKHVFSAQPSRGKKVLI